MVFSDPAGAKACLALAEMLGNRGDSFCRLYSNRSFPFFSDWKSHVHHLDSFALEETAKPQWMLTGTSHPESSNRFELSAIQWASKRGIRTISFVDHWTGLGLRFHHPDGLIWPDHIVVLDQVAYELAISEGLPPQRLSMESNPYHDYIRTHWKPALTRDELAKELSIDPNHAWVVYAPDPVSLGRTPESILDEVDVLESLHRSISRTDVWLVVQPHPLQPARLSEWATGKPQVRWVESGSIHNLELARQACVVVGFYSNYLVEAHAVGAPVVRYLPNNINDPLRHWDVALLTNSLVELTSALESYMDIPCR